MKKVAFCLIVLLTVAVSASAQTWTAGTPIYYNPGGGSANVGIGTNTPGILGVGRILTISSPTFSVIETQRTPAQVGGDIGVFDFYNGSDRVGEFEVAPDGALDSGRFIFWTKPTGGGMAARMTIASNGFVGINVGPSGAPAAMLDVRGNVSVTGTVTGTNIVAQYQDVAEWVPTLDKLTPGMVVAIDPENSNHVVAVGRAYDTTIAGVISAQPGISLGEKADNKVLVATTGRVKVQVDATKRPIKRGDLLVASSASGVAMASEPIDMGGVMVHRPGTVIGKALEPLASGRGEILVLLSLQ